MLRRDLLQRFRPVGAPGTTAGVGVPEAARDRAAIELAPVFAALRPTVDACRTWLERADAEAAGEIAAADRYAEDRFAPAAADAEVARREASEAVRKEAEAYATELLVRANAEAGAILSRGRAAMPALIAQVKTRGMDRAMDRVGARP